MVMNPRDRSAAIVGGFVIVAAASFIFLFGAATNRTLTRDRSEIWIELPTAEGLKKGDAVLLRGVQVGEVKRITFGDDDAVTVQAILTQPVPLTSSARARLVAADMFGRQTVVLEHRAGGSPLASGDTLDGIPPVSLNARIEGLAGQVERVLGDSTVSAIQELLVRAAAALDAVDHTADAARAAMAADAPLQQTLRDASHITASVRAVADSTALLELRSSAHGTLLHLSSVLARMDSTSESMLRAVRHIEAGNGTLGLVASDPELYRRAVSTLDGLDELLRDVRRNPKRYINVSVF